MDAENRSSAVQKSFEKEVRRLKTIIFPTLSFLEKYEKV